MYTKLSLRGAESRAWLCGPVPWWGMEDPGQILGLEMRQGTWLEVSQAAWAVMDFLTSVTVVIVMQGEHRNIHLTLTWGP